MKRLWNILNRLSGNNRGSGIVVVLVSMTCIALMGASLLFMSYTAVRMRATERQASRDFYSAETAVDEIRAGAQSMASDALGKAYKTVLTTYSEGGQMNQRFADAFVDELKKTGLITNNESRYNPDILFRYVSNRTGVAVSGSGTVDNDDLDKLVLEDITVTYTANNGYTTTITTDICIGMPEFAYVLSGNSLTGLPEHALIANEKLMHTGQNSTIKISGSAYVGNMDLQTAGSQLTISDGTLVCANDAAVSGYTSGGRLVTTDNVKLWAGRVAVTGGGTINLNGETRVLDDLELAGSKSSATLKGSYYGFGDGTTPTGVTVDDAAKYSSAILINGLDCTLNLSGLDQLMLAGRSYISDSLYAGHTFNAKRVGMLESVAVRSSQQMYLFDTTDFMVDLDKNTSTAPVFVDQNPFLATTQDLLATNPDGSYKWITLTEEAQQRANQYGYKLTARQYAFPGQNVIYCFMEFTELNKANAYFEERFAKYNNQINNYLTNDTNAVSIEYSNLNVSDSSSTYGYSLSGNGSANDPYSLSRPTRTQFYPAGMRATFNQLKKTLIDGNTRVDENTTPYTYIVNTAKVTALDNNAPKEFSLDGQVLGVVVDGPYAITNSTPSSMRLVIASGDVTVSADYNGLIISGKNITLSGDGVDIKHDESGVLKAFEAVAGTETMGTYLLHGVNEGEDAVEAGGVEGWNLDTLITYENWTKN